MASDLSTLIAICLAVLIAKGIIYFSPLTNARESVTLFSSDRENANDH